MIKPLVIGILCSFTLWSSANACSLLPYADFEGREFNYHSPDSMPRISSYVGENRFIAIVKTKLVRQEPAKYGGYTENVLRFKVKDVIHGDIRTLPKRKFPHDPDATNPKNISTFNMWENNEIKSPTTLIGTGPDSCGRSYPALLLQPRERYLVIGTIGSDGDPYIYSAAILETKKDPIISAIRKIAANADDAPNKISAEDYFKNMSGFAEINILQCPKREDFVYTDSRFATAEKQIGTLVSFEDTFNVSTDRFDFRDIGHYQNQKTQNNNYSDKASAVCQYGHKYLHIKSSFDKYLAITQGRINTDDIITNFEITGSKLVNVTNIKNWIREANTP